MNIGSHLTFLELLNPSIVAKTEDFQKKELGLVWYILGFQVALIMNFLLMDLHFLSSRLVVP